MALQDYRKSRPVVTAQAWRSEDRGCSVEEHSLGMTRDGV